MLATYLKDIVDREILCVFNDIDFEKVMVFFHDNKDNAELLTKDIIYMVNENNVNISKIKEIFNKNVVEAQQNTLDIYVKNGFKWEKSQE